MEPLSLETKLMKTATSLEVLLAASAAAMTGSEPPSPWAMCGAVNDLTTVLHDLEAEHERYEKEHMAASRAVEGQ